MNQEEQMVAREIERMTGSAITNVAKCRGCGEGIYWGVTRNGKRCPYDADGKTHFATCFALNKFRKSR